MLYRVFTWNFKFACYLDPEFWDPLPGPWNLSVEPFSGICFRLDWNLNFRFYSLDLALEIWDFSFGVWNLRFGIYSLDVEILFLLFGAWILEFGISSLDPGS